MCDICEIQHHIHPPGSQPVAGVEGFTGILDVIQRVYSGNLVSKIDPELWKFTSKALFEGAEKGFGKKLIDLDYDTPDHDMLKGVRDNVFVFSGFKTYQELRTMSDALIGENGKPVSFDVFKEKCLEIHRDYDIRFLEAEYDNALKSGQSISQWMKIQEEKEDLPFLKYQTVGDNRVRLEHRALDNVTLPVDHPFWNTYYPPNDWGCRCDVIQVDRGKLTDVSKIAPPEMKPMFKNNVGKNGIIFPEKHPYYNVPKKDEKAIIDFVIKQLKAPVFVPAKTLKEAESRLSSLGIETVKLKGLDTDKFNAVLKIVENEASFGEFDLKELVTYTSKKDGAKAIYTNAYKKIQINLNYVNKFEKTKIISYEDQISKYKELITEYRTYVGNPKWRQGKVLAELRAFSSYVRRLEAKIANGETALQWTVSANADTLNESLELTVSHELGHYRHYKHYEAKKLYTTEAKDSISEYGKVNHKEYWCEWFCHYRKFGEKGVPEDILKLFKEIDNGRN